MSATFAKPQAVKARSTICLITALTVVDFIDPELTTETHANTGAQLGVLTLAALLREQGYEPIVLNLDNLFYDFVRRDKRRWSHQRFVSSYPEPNARSHGSHANVCLTSENF